MEASYTVWDDEPGRSAGASVTINSTYVGRSSMLVRDPNIALLAVEILKHPDVGSDLLALKHIFDHAYLAAQVEWSHLPLDEGPCLFCGDVTDERLNVSPVGESWVCPDCEGRMD